MTFPIRQTSRLHYGRISIPCARYFVTFTTGERRPWLVDSQCRKGVNDVLRGGHEAGDWTVLIATCMPDHVHVLFELGAKMQGLSVGRCVARWKAVSRRIAPRGEGWQRDFWEHRLRPEDLQEDYGRYVFMNPYRAKLLPCAHAWEGTWIPNAMRFRFVESLNASGGPPPEWLGVTEQVLDGKSTP